MARKLGLIHGDQIPGALSGIEKDKEWVRGWEVGGGKQEIISLFIHPSFHSTFIGSLAEWSQIQALESDKPVSGFVSGPTAYNLRDLERVSSLNLNSLKCKVTTIILSPRVTGLLAILRFSHWGNSTKP